MFDFVDSALNGVYVVRPRLQTDERGSFTKLFHRRTFEDRGLVTQLPEIYVSTSRRDVVRGMHFQLPPHQHDKLVYCTGGAVVDVVVDLRAHSPTFQQHASFDLNDENGVGIYIPKGCAHGFLAVSAAATMVYLVETMYAPEADAGIRWDSIGFDWPVASPVISARDETFCTLAEFRTPF